MAKAATTTNPGNHPYVRRWPRYKVHTLIRVVICRAMKVSIIDGRGTSLSDGGMALFAGTELKPGDQVAVEFSLPYSAPPVRVDARICNRSGYTYGVEFLNSTEKHKAAQFRSHLSSLAGLVQQ